MNLTDRRLLIELGVILAAKVAIIALLKMHFFSPAPANPQHPLETKARAPAHSGSDSSADLSREPNAAEEER